MVGKKINFESSPPCFRPNVSYMKPLNLAASSTPTPSPLQHSLSLIPFSVMQMGRELFSLLPSLDSSFGFLLDPEDLIQDLKIQKFDSRFKDSKSNSTIQPMIVPSAVVKTAIIEGHLS